MGGDSDENGNNGETHLKIEDWILCLQIRKT